LRLCRPSIGNGPQSEVGACKRKFQIAPHLINRLRLRIAEDVSDSTRHAVGFIFAERDHQGRTRYRPVKPNRYGGLDPEVPMGFFDQTPRESLQILRAAIRKKKALAGSQILR
jgi:hypothetical protein